MIHFLILALCLLATPAFADFWIGPGAVSFHTDRSTPHNEINSGVNLEYAFDPVHAIGVGQYKNSEWDQTRYVAYRYTPMSIGNLRLGMYAGVLDGYQRVNHGGPMPAAFMAAVYEYQRFGYNLLATPYDGGVVLAIQFKLRLF